MWPSSCAASRANCIRRSSRIRLTDAVTSPRARSRADRVQVTTTCSWPRCPAPSMPSSSASCRKHWRNRGARPRRHRRRSASAEGRQLLCTVCDDGDGFGVAGTGRGRTSGLGLILIRGRLEASAAHWTSRRHRGRHAPECRRAAWKLRCRCACSWPTTMPSSAKASGRSSSATVRSLGRSGERASGGPSRRRTEAGRRLLDVSMPLLNGVDAGREIQRAHKDTHVVLSRCTPTTG